MRILVVSSFLPFPLFDGGNVRLYNLLKQLSQNHKITLICEIRGYQSEEDIKEIRKYCEEVITIPHQKPWTARNILKAGFSLTPLLLIMHTFPEMKQKIVETLNKKSFDLVHVETFYVMQNLPKTYLPVVLAEHNIEYDIYKRYAQTASPYVRPFLYIDIAKIKYWEEKFWKKATKLIAVSEGDKRKMNRNDVEIIANGVDCDLFQFLDMKKKEKRKEKRVLFMGSFKYIQNIHAVEWIVKEIWPEIIKPFQKRKEQTPILWVVGKNIPEVLKAYESNTIIFDEHAPDETWRIYHMSDVLLAPLKIGGGSSYKIIESMASGIPVVTTELGASGINAKPHIHLLQGETPQELAAYVVKLLQNKTTYEKIQRNARKLIEENYDWKKIAKKLESIYQSVVTTNQ